MCSRSHPAHCASERLAQSCEGSRDTRAAVDLMAALFCDERLQESSILHAAPDNHQFDLQSRRQARGAPSSICHPVSTLASRGDIVQLPSSGQLSDQQIPSAPRDEMEVSAKSCPHLATHTPTHTHTHTHTRTRWPLAAGRWEPHGEADSLTYCALSRYRPRLGWCL